MHRIILFLEVQNEAKLNYSTRSLHLGKKNGLVIESWGNFWGGGNSKSWLSGSYTGICFVIIHCTIQI
jgi:hypothetical protein